jgi:hypothetical protein
MQIQVFNLTFSVKLPLLPNLKPVVQNLNPGLYRRIKINFAMYQN